MCFPRSSVLWSKKSKHEKSARDAKVANVSYMFISFHVYICTYRNWKFLHHPTFLGKIIHG